jgi:filamentous hemagglutinin family protein
MAILPVCTVCCVLFASLAIAEVVTAITDSGLNTAVSPKVNGVVTITKGTRNGPNLFHSFGVFNVGAADTANFVNDAGITTNILSRVTGGSASNIFGTIKTTGFGGANLFLINPAGVVFGPNATLDIGRTVGTPGSFHVSTADYLRLGDPGGANEGKFSASPLVSDVLTSAPVTAFGFLSTTAAAIAIQNSKLEVGNGKAISLIGGNGTFLTDGGEIQPGITMTGGTLSAPGGEIRLVSVASPGEVLFSNLQTGPNINGDAFTDHGPISLTSRAKLDASGDPGGTVLIRGGRLVMDSASIVADTESDTHGATVGINIAANEIQLKTGSNIATSSLDGVGSAGDIVITVRDSLSISGVDASEKASRIESHGDTGNGGDITITGASSTVALDNRGAIRTGSFSDGLAGTITIDINGLTISGGSVIESFGSELAPSGSINLTTQTIALSGRFDSGPRSRIANMNPNSGGTAGISINTGTLSLADGARINGNGVLKITVVATDSVSLTESSGIGLSASLTDLGSIELSASTITVGGQSEIQTITVSAGNGGAINVHGRDLVIADGGQMNSSTQQGLGTGGPISVNMTGQVLISGAGSGITSESSQFAQGGGGNIQVNGRDIDLGQGASISARSFGSGFAGNIDVTAAESFTLRDSSITTSTQQSDGGNIRIKAGNFIHLVNSEITTSVGSGAGTGGNIDLDPPIVILDSSKIIASAVGGNGGDINIVASFFLRSPDTVIDASSDFGVSGNVSIQTPLSNLSGSLAPLPQNFLQAGALLASRCAARVAGGSTSSFVVAGRDSVPLEPGAMLPSTLLSATASSLSGIALAVELPTLVASRLSDQISYDFVTPDRGCS